MMVALIREVSAAIDRCELTHLAREPIDLMLARAQHEAYARSLAEAGCRVEWLTAGADMPDSVFIEDIALVFDEMAVMTRPGASSRRLETPGVAHALRRYKPLHAIEPPGTMDGGDVLVVGRHLFVGRSRRTNQAGIDQLCSLLTPYGYDVVPVDVRACLHLKSAVTAVGDDLLLINRMWLPAEPFSAFDAVEVHPGEPGAANALRVGDRILYPSAFPRTLERLERRGLSVRTVDASEVAKAEGAVTCCSLIFSA
jgi:dimethylargininase